MHRYSAPLSQGRRGGGKQCPDTQVLYLKVRVEVGTMSTDTQDIYLKIRGDVGDMVQTHRTSI